jgi:hypothetical protein
LIRKSGTGSRVPAWIWDLYEATCAECAASWGPGPGDTRIAPEFRIRLDAALSVVNKPDGVDPTAFSAALKLGGWAAARDLCAGAG